MQIKASGLVAAVERVMRACGGTWIAHGSGSADKETVDANDRVGVPPRDGAYMLRRVWLSEDEQDGDYHGFANEGYGRYAISPSSDGPSATATGSITSRE